MVILRAQGVLRPPLCPGAYLKDEAKGLNDCSIPPRDCWSIQTPSFLFRLPNPPTLRAQACNKGEQGSGGGNGADCKGRSGHRVDSAHPTGSGFIFTAASARASETLTCTGDPL